MPLHAYIDVYMHDGTGKYLHRFRYLVNVFEMLSATFTTFGLLGKRLERVKG